MLTILGQCRPNLLCPVVKFDKQIVHSLERLTGLEIELPIGLPKLIYPLPKCCDTLVELTHLS